MIFQIKFEWDLQKTKKYAVHILIFGIPCTHGLFPKRNQERKYSDERCSIHGKPEYPYGSGESRRMAVAF